MPIGFFQFDNLLRQRVPFYLLSAVDLAPLGYIGTEKMHLGHVTTAVTAGTSFSEMELLITEKGLDKGAPIVVVCQDGEWSQTIVNQLQDAKYINAFYVLGGLDELLKGP